MEARELNVLDAVFSSLGISVGEYCRAKGLAQDGQRPALLTRQEVMKELRISDNTLRAIVNKGILDKIVLDDEKNFRFSPEQVDNYKRHGKEWRRKVRQ